MADEDREQDPDRWCSHSAWGQECWQLVSQWVWNLRLSLGHQREPTSLRITAFAPAIPPQSEHTAACPASPAPAPGYGPPAIATSWKTGRFSGQDFPLQPDGTLRGPAGQQLRAQERRREADGSLRVVYAASSRSCRPCPLREQCQWNGSATAKPRQVSVLLHPLAVGSAPLLWRDWHRRLHRRACLPLHRQRLDVQMEQALAPPLRCLASASFSCTAGALSPQLSRTAGAQCTSSDGESDYSQAVRYPRSCCHLARTNHGLARPRQSSGSLATDTLAAPNGDACASFPGRTSTSLLFCSFRLSPPVSAISQAWVSRSARSLSPDQKLTLQQARCAIRGSFHAAAGGVREKKGKCGDTPIPFR